MPESLLPGQQALVDADRALAAGDYEAAIAILQQASEENPTDLVLLRALAQVLIEAEHYAEASHTIDRILVLVPDDVEARFGQGVVQAQMGNYQTAADIYEALLDADLTDAYRQRTLFNLAVVYQANGMSGSAQWAWLKYLELNDEDAEAHAHMAEVLLDLGDTRRALEHFRRAAVLEPENLDAQMNMVSTARATGQYGWVVIGLKRAVAIEPNNPSLWNQLGAAALTIYDATDDLNALRDAVDAWERSLAIEPNQPAIQDYLTTYQQQTGEGQSR
jgi:tetratricopeptide (TPR) repeat protein